VGIAVAAVICGAMCLAGIFGQFGSSPVPDMETVEVDRGDVELVVVEKGSLETSDDDVVRCRVESFQGLPVGPPPPSAEPRPSASRAARITLGGAAIATGGTDPPVIAAFKSRETMARSSGARAKSAIPTSSAGASLPAKTAAAQPKAASAVPLALASAMVPDDASASDRPAIRSFDHIVEPHVPLRTTLPDQGATPAVAPPPPTILSIVAEGTTVTAGDVVCELDSSAFRDALTVQQLRFVQANAWVEQAKYVLEASEIGLREYELGVFPQDLELVRRYIEVRETELKRAARNLTWAQDVRAKGYRTETQLDADQAAFQQAEIAFRDAEAMRTRLVRYTGARIKKALRAKVEAVRADLLSLQSSFQLEAERLRRIEAMVANCTMRAPRDGIIVYANRTNGRGRIELQIREGLTVYPSQPIFRLLDARNLQVRARINESQIMRVRSGQSVMIHLDAFPDRVLTGSVAEIIPIPSLVDGPYSDVRSFYANVRIESGGFAALRPGMSAELRFLVEKRHEVTRVPLEAIRWVDDRSYAVVAAPNPDGPDWLWRPVALGAFDAEFAEVKSGLAPGDRVIAHCDHLPEMESDQLETQRDLDLAMMRPRGNQ
jgi:multidrug resistance efflux pump